MYSLLPLVLTALGVRPAAAAEFREITLSDERVIRGEVLASSDTGLRLQLHQGTTFVPYSDILSIQNIDEAGWHGSDQVWRAAVSSISPGAEDLRSSAERAEELVAQALSDFPGLEVIAPGESLLRCGGDLDCALSSAREDGLDLVVLGAVERPEAGAERLKLTAVFTASDRARLSAAIPWDPEDERAPVVALNALYPVLGLEPDPERVQALIDGRSRSEVGRQRSEQPTETESGTPGTEADAPDPEAGTSTADGVVPGLSEGQVAGLSFIPIPGFPSLYQRDLRRFGLSWAAVVPATAVYVGVAGASSVRRGQLLGLGFAGYYVTTVTVNRIMGARSLEGEPLLSLEPRPGGAVVGLTLALP